MFRSIDTRFGSVWLQTHYKEFDKPLRWSHRRGRCEEHVWQMPIFKWDLVVHSPGKSYVELTGCPKYSLDWILDEFDSSFNDLAVASLRFHLGFACTDKEDQRHVYEGIITRLSEPRPDFTDEEMAVLHPPGWVLEDEFDVLEVGGALCRPLTPEKRAVYDEFRDRELAYDSRIQQARHDFVDIMPGLWS